jgi:hypothetical protein
MGRVGNAGELEGVAVFLAAPASGYITGHHPAAGSSRQHRPDRNQSLCVRRTRNADRLNAEALDVLDYQRIA